MMAAVMLMRFIGGVKEHFPHIVGDVDKRLSAGSHGGTFPEWKVETLISEFKHVEGFREFVLGFLGGDIHDLS
jgi:hypothetical protein